MGILLSFLLNLYLQVVFEGKVHKFWEGQKILRNLHLTFVLCSASQEEGEDDQPPAGPWGQNWHVSLGSLRMGSHLQLMINQNLMFFVICLSVKLQ